VKIVQYLQIGRCLKVHRLQAGIPQRTMADKLGIPAATYSNYENGYSSPAVETIQDFCRITGMEASDFFKYAVERAAKEGSAASAAPRR
jgi:transcriptional regulator with XRE-family HTH domain